MLSSFYQDRLGIHIGKAALKTERCVVPFQRRPEEEESKRLKKKKKRQAAAAGPRGSGGGSGSSGGKCTDQLRRCCSCGSGPGAVALHHALVYLLGWGLVCGIRLYYLPKAAVREAPLLSQFLY
jgi:hypothetical protein